MIPTAKLKPKMMRICLNPKEASGIYNPKNLAKNIFTKMHPTHETMLANTMLISEIVSTETRNILKMSLPFAPSALKIPISIY